MKRFAKAYILFFITVLLALSSSAAGQVQVSSANPNAAEQGTVNLNVTISGKGFKNGAKAKWFVAGSTNPGGVVVNSTAFVNSTTLTANITVSDAAVISNFDIQVQNSDGRIGKGTELFAVNMKGSTKASLCTVVPALTSVTSCTSSGAGCLDASFGGTGIVLTNTTGAVPKQNDLDKAYAVGVQADGKLVTIGVSNIAIGDQRFSVVRYNPDGGQDSSFGSNGIAIAPHSPGVADFPKDGILQPDGKILAVGFTWFTGSPNIMTAVRFNSDGSMDQSFGSGGRATFSFPTSTSAEAVALQSDGKIIITGGSWQVARLNPNGSLDSSFGSGGTTTINLGRRVVGTSAAVTIQRITTGTVTQEFVLIGGTIADNFGMVRLSPNGSVDTAFGTSQNGMIQTDFCSAPDRIRRLALDANGSIVAAGWVHASTANGSPGKFGLARYSSNGVLDLNFGDSSSTLASSIGKTSLNFVGGDDSLWGLAIQADGRMLLSGYAGTPGTVSQNYFGVARFDANGALDSTFGINGALVTAIGETASGTQVAIQADGKLVVVGTAGFSSGANTGYNYAIARYWY